jgi:hypothetical protein
MMKLHSIELTQAGKAALMAACLNALECPGSFVLGSDTHKHDVELVGLTKARVADTSKRRHVDMSADVYRELIATPDNLIALHLTDRETGKPHVLTPYKIYKAWWRLLRNEKKVRTPGGAPMPFCAQSYALRLIALGLFGDEAETTDAYTDDILVQLAVFGDVIYG